MFTKEMWTRIVVVAGAYYDPRTDVTLIIHGDDVLAEGTDRGLDELGELLMQYVEIKRLGRCGPERDRQARFLKRTIEWRRDRFVWKADPKHVRNLLKELDLEDAKVADSPGSKDTGKAMRDALDLIEGDQATLVRSAAGTENYLALDRPDIMYASKTCMSEISAPTKLMEARVKRLARYLAGVPELEWHFVLQDMPTEVVPHADSDWASEVTHRRSTSCCMTYFGQHLLEGISCTQHPYALSSGEAEFYAVNRGAAGGILVVQFLEQAGVPGVQVHCRTDSSAARGIVNRIGSGKLKHIELRELWMQEKIRAKQLKVSKISTDENTADVGTKYLSGERIRYLIGLAGMRAVDKGLASSSVGAITAATLLQGADARFSASGEVQYGSDLGAISGFLVVLAMIAVFILGLGVGRCWSTAMAVMPAARPAVTPAVGPATGSGAKPQPPTGSPDATTDAQRCRHMRRIAQLPGLKAQDTRKELLNIYTQGELAEALRREGLPSSGLKADQIARLLPKLMNMDVVTAVAVVARYSKRPPSLTTFLSIEAAMDFIGGV